MRIVLAGESRNPSLHILVESPTASLVGLTLGIRWNNFIANFVQAQLENSLSTPQELKRGNLAEGSKQTKEQTITHINAFNL